MIEPAEPSLKLTISRAAAGCAARPAPTTMATERTPAKGREQLGMINPHSRPPQLPAPAIPDTCSSRRVPPRADQQRRRMRIKRLTIPDLRRAAAPISGPVLLLGHASVG